MCKMLELTLTCFACGIPSSSLWARRVRRRRPGSGSSSRSTHNHRYSPSSAPFYSQLEGKDCPPGAVVNEDGTVNLCAFCFALLDSASRGNVEGARVAGMEGSPGMGGSSTIWKFVCGVCGVETYRKRVRALPLQKFQFLSKTRKPGSISITLGESECAVVCLDCSETLWTQSDEYDRWGLPEHKRHFNWMLRPPPPEDSEEANLARLPSGKAQLPRTPPTEPVLPITNLIQHQTNPEMEQPSIRHYQRSVKVISRPSSVSSNSNSSNSNFPMDFESLQQQPLPKRQRMVQNGSPPPWLTMDQSLPHMESLDLSTRQSQSPSTSSQQSGSDNGPTLLQSVTTFPFSQQYPPPLIPLSKMSYLTYSTPHPTGASVGPRFSEEVGQRNTSPTSSTGSYPSSRRGSGGAYQGGSGRQRSTPIPILTTFHGRTLEGHPLLHNYITGPEFRPRNPEVQTRLTQEQHHQQILHRPHFVYTARPPPTLRETDSAYFRPFLSRIPTRLGGERLQRAQTSGSQKFQQQSHSRPQSEIKQETQPQNLYLSPDQSRSKTEILPSTSKFRRCSAPVALGSAPASRSTSRPRPSEGTIQVALLPKKRRSWDHINRMVEGDPQISEIKHTPRPRQNSNSKQTT